MRKKIKLLILPLLTIFLFACASAGGATSAVLKSAESFGKIEDESSFTSSGDESIDKVMDWTKDELGDYFDVYYKRDIHSIVLYPKTEAMATDFELILRDVGKPDKWIELFNSVQELSVIISDRADDEELSLSVSEPLDDRYMLVVMKNGEEMHNGFKEVGLY